MWSILFSYCQRGTGLFVKADTTEPSYERDIWEKVMEIKDQINELLGMLYNPVVQAKLNELEETVEENYDQDK